MSLTLAAADRPALEPAAAAEHRMVVRRADQAAHELEQAVVGGLPVEPGDLVVLAVGVVVAAAACGRSRRRRSSIGTPCESSSVARKLRFCRARSAMISGSSVGPSTPQFQERLCVLAVAVLLAVGLVVLLVVGDQVAQREAVVGGDEVDAGVRPPAGALVEVGAAGEARAELARASDPCRARSRARCRGTCRSTPTRAAGSCRPGSRPRRRPTARR